MDDSGARGKTLRNILRERRGDRGLPTGTGAISEGVTSRDQDTKGKEDDNVIQRRQTGERS